MGVRYLTSYFIILASIMTAELTITESKNHTELTFNRRYSYVPIFVNICDIKDRRANMHCYCDINKIKMAKKADCWLFGGGITENDPIWPNFSSQSEIEQLLFNVRSDEALTFIPGKAIVRLDNLKHLTIQFGNISYIPQYAFTNSSTIKQIILKSNKIRMLEKHSFSQMMMLSNLSLEDNLISELRWDVFFNLPNLHVLHLSNNNLSLIHDGSFKHLNNLLELKLEDNFISIITKETLQGLENLSRLNLKNNKLSMIGNLAFSEAWSLKELMLDNNVIEFISDRAFGGLTQLRKLTLANNRLTIFYEDILEDVRNLIVLDLRDNLLDTISYESIRPVVENDKSFSTAVYLDGNPLSCNCRLSWVYALRNETKDSTRRNALEEISCITDPVAEKPLHQEPKQKLEKSKVLPDENYDYYDKNIDYDNVDTKVKATARKLIYIPVETLPCPKEIMKSVEESYGHPVQNEIRLKAFSGAGSYAVNSILITLLAKVMLNL